MKYVTEYWMEHSYFLGRRQVLEDVILILISSFAFLTFFYHSFLLQRPIEASGGYALYVPYLSYNLNIILSSTTPWYVLLSNCLYILFPFLYGQVLNGLEVYLIGLAPIPMYFLLRELNFNRSVSVFSSVLYLVNPISFPLLFSYLPLTWAEFYIFLPMIAFFAIRYARQGRITDILVIAALLTAYIQIQLSPYLYNFRMVLPAVGILILVSIASRFGSDVNRSQLIKRDLPIFLLLLFLNFVPLVMSNGQPYVLPGTQNPSLFYNYHLRNILYTYQSQNWFYAISGLVVYPHSTNSLLEGNGQKFHFLTVIWVSVVLAAVIVSFIRKNKERKFMLSFSLSAIISWIFISLVQAHLILWIFKISSLFFLWEYPSYLEMPLAFIYIPLIAGLIDFIGKNANANIDCRAAKIRKFGHAKILTSERARKASSLAVLLIVISVAILPMLYSNTSGFTGPTESDTLPSYYNAMTSFFHDREGNYKVLLVPYNQSNALMLNSAVPKSNELILPPSYQNYPEEYANATFFDFIYSAINSENYGNFTYYLNWTFVKYIVILNNAVSQRLTDSLESLPYLKVSKSNLNYTILEYKYFNGALVSPNPVFYEPNPIGNTTVNNSSFELIKNYNFTEGGKYWGDYSSNIPHGSQVNFSRGGTVICVYGNNSSNRQLTQLWQVVWIGPGAQLTISVNVESQSNSHSTLYFLFHDNSYVTTDHHFTSQSAGFNLPTNKTGVFYYNLTAPMDTEFAYVGVFTWNESKGPGYIKIGYLSLLNNIKNTPYDFSNYPPTVEFPVIQLANNAAATYQNYSILRPIRLLSLVEPAFLPNISFNPSLPSLGLHNLSLEIPSIVPAEGKLLLDIEILPNSTLSFGNQSYFPSTIPVEISVSNQMGNTAETLTVHGYVTVLGAWIETSNSRGSNITYTIWNDRNNALIGFEGTGIAEIFIPTSDVFSISGSMSVLQKEEVYSGFLILVKVGGDSLFTAHSVFVYPPMIAYNAAIAATVAGIIVLAVVKRKNFSDLKL